MINARFGTFRGLVRLALSYPQLALGQSATLRPDPAEVHRLVFVCQGNICRSAFADVVAHKAGGSTTRPSVRERRTNCSTSSTEAAASMGVGWTTSS